MSVLESWNKKFGDLDVYNGKSPGEFIFDYDIAYPSQVCEAEVGTDHRAHVVVRLKLVICREDAGSRVEAGRCTEMFALPKQLSDLSKPAHEVIHITKKRLGDIACILRASDRVKYELFDRAVVVDGRRSYLDFSGNEMTDQEYSARQQHINTLVMQWCEKVHTQDKADLPGLVGTQFFMVKARNPKTPPMPFVNIYPNRPSQIPIFGCKT